MENNSKEFIQQAPPSLLTVSQFCIKHVFITQGDFAFKFQCCNNGLASFGAIVRMGRKVLIDESRYFEW